MHLAEEIPQGNVDAGNRRGTHDPAAVPKMLPPHHLPEMLDARGILANEPTMLRV
jgi:hypothetical protein